MNTRRAPKRGNNTVGIPAWVTVTVILVLLGLFAYNILFVGPEGYPTNVILGGLLGAYAGIDQLLKRRKDDDQDPPPPGGAT